MNGLVLSNLAHVLSTDSRIKFLERKIAEVDPSIKENKKLLKYQQGNKKVFSAPILAQRDKNAIAMLQESNELTVAFLSNGVYNMREELKKIFRPDVDLSKMTTEGDLHKLKFT